MLAKKINVKILDTRARTLYIQHFQTRPLEKRGDEEERNPRHMIIIIITSVSPLRFCRARTQKKKPKRGAFCSEADSS